MCIWYVIEHSSKFLIGDLLFFHLGHVDADDATDGLV